MLDSETISTEDKRKEGRNISELSKTSREELFKVHEMRIYSKKEQKEGGFEAFLDRIPENYEGLIFCERSRDPIGRSGRLSNVGRSVSI